MKNETDMGGSRQSFPETAWSAILANPDAASPIRRAKLESLCSRYWRPVYKFIRLARAKSVEDAKDLTQDFFIQILDENLLAHYVPERGRFRTFLKAVLKNFLNRNFRDGNRIKRGGGRIAVPLDPEAFENEASLADERQRPPDEIFDRQWARDVMSRGLVGLHEECVAQGKEIVFKAYEAYELKGGSPTYENVAKELGISVTEVTNHLHLARQRLEAIVTETILDYVTDPAEAIREMRDLFSR